MPPRSTPQPRGSFYPSHDSSTYRDLLLFEERLKTTAASLQRRKSRYQLFLAQLLLVISFLLFEVFSGTSLLTIPYKFLLQHLLPEIYTPDTQVSLHPYVASGLLFVSVTTLVLFFASGMYSEKIAYANQYVPHANRALRSFNMYLNVRKPPLRSKFYFNPLAFFFPRTPPSPPPASPTTANLRSRSRSPTGGSAALPLAPIPPATNPRGELIFSSRVDRPFRESYERYRSAFERKREEREREERNKRGWRKWAARVLPWWQPLKAEGAGATGMVSGSPSRPPSARGRVSRSGTPPTPVGSQGSLGRQGAGQRGGTSGGGVARQGSQREDMRTIALERSLLQDR